MELVKVLNIMSYPSFLHLFEEITKHMCFPDGCAFLYSNYQADSSQNLSLNSRQRNSRTTDSFEAFRQLGDSSFEEHNSLSYLCYRNSSNFFYCRAYMRKKDSNSLFLIHHQKITHFSFFYCQKIYSYSLVCYEDKDSYSEYDGCDDLDQ